MDRGAVTTLALLTCGALVVPSAGAGTTRASVASTHNRRVAITLPSAGSGRFVEFTEHVTVAKGKTASVKVASLNEGQLPPGIRAEATVSPRVSTKHNSVFRVWVGINNLATHAGDVRMARPVASHLEIVLKSVGTGPSIWTEDLAFSCSRLVKLGDLVDASPGDFELYPLAQQASDPEEILDHLAYDRYKCPGAETPELGPG